MNHSRIRLDLRAVAGIALTGILSVMTAVAQERNVGEYNLQAGVGLKGYDPVSYFPEGGSQPQVGQTNLQWDYKGVAYLFANSENRDQFVQNPDKYEPTYGGWCAYAMASGSKVDINPMIYTIHGNRLHLFIAKRAKQNFDSDVIGYEKRADEFWKKFSGEDPRYCVLSPN